MLAKTTPERATDPTLNAVCAESGLIRKSLRAAETIAQLLLAALQRASTNSLEE